MKFELIIHYDIVYNRQCCLWQHRSTDRGAEGDVGRAEAIKSRKSRERTRSSQSELPPGRGAGNARVGNERQLTTFALLIHIVSL